MKTNEIKAIDWDSPEIDKLDDNYKPEVLTYREFLTRQGLSKTEVDEIYERNGLKIIEE